MAVEKISISLDEELLELAREAADAEDLSLSAWLAEAARDRARQLGLKRLVEEYEAEFGSFTPEEEAEAQAWLDDAKAELLEIRRQQR